MELSEEFKNLIDYSPWFVEYLNDTNSYLKEYLPKLVYPIIPGRNKVTVKLFIDSSTKFFNELNTLKDVKFETERYKDLNLLSSIPKHLEDYDPFLINKHKLLNEYVLEGVLKD